MAKGNKNSQQNKKKLEEDKSPGLFQKFFFWVLIPFLFVVAILLVVAQFTGTNVFEKAMNVTNILSLDEKGTEKTVDNSQKIVNLQAEIKEKEAEIEQLQIELEELKAKNHDAEIEKEQLQFRISELQRENDQSQKEFNEILSTYEKMSAKNAAPIITQLSDDQAVRILSSLKPEKLSEIFSKMDPADAARYTELLSN